MCLKGETNDPTRGTPAARTTYRVHGKEKSFPTPSKFKRSLYVFHYSKDHLLNSSFNGIIKKGWNVLLWCYFKKKLLVSKRSYHRRTSIKCLFVFHQRRSRGMMAVRDGCCFLFSRRVRKTTDRSSRFLPYNAGNTYRVPCARMNFIEKVLN